MKATVAEAMEAGAFEFSVGLAYAPGDYAHSDEVIELAKVSAACGGMFGTHGLLQPSESVATMDA